MLHMAIRTNGHSPTGKVEDGLELKLAFDGEVLHGEVVLPVVRQALVERGVLLLSDLLRVARPDRLGLVELLVLDGRLLDLLGLLLLGLLVDFFNLGVLLCPP